MQGGSSGTFGSWGLSQAVGEEESALASSLPTASLERKKFRNQRSREKWSKKEEPSEEKILL